jgi:hypothetical protein
VTYAIPAVMRATSAAKVRHSSTHTGCRTIVLPLQQMLQELVKLLSTCSMVVTCGFSCHRKMYESL